MATVGLFGWRLADVSILVEFQWALFGLMRGFALRTVLLSECSTTEIQQQSCLQLQQWVSGIVPLSSWLQLHLASY